MQRREFLKWSTMLAGAAALGPTAFVTGCASPRVRPTGESVDTILFGGPRVMWVAAHPDDESMLGALLAKAGLAYQCPLYFLVLTHGDGGECCRPEGCLPDLPTVRGEEIRRVAALYRAELQHERFYNAPLPVESFPKRHELARIWAAERDPAALIAEAMRRFRPDVVFTFEPTHGFTGHPEHQLASRFAMAGARLAADPQAAVPGFPHRVSHLYFGLNRYWPYTVFAGGDPGPVTETWDATAPCLNGWDCRRVMAEFTRPHRSQARDMGTVRLFTNFIDKVYLRKVDPFVTIYDPFETA
ncbi:MAG: hypothetical protein C4523_17965 [Myxococcales bacterium]|nr:MAG: hypothetical protein C4523_17965 [Myxococcales bacterium]